MRTNKEIRAPKLRLIGKDGKQIGVVTNSDAQKQAQQAGLDLVEISPNAVPPVCKIIDYGKFRYQMTKKERESKKAQHQAKLKEVKVKPNIDEHDLQVKIKRAREFIEKGNKVRVTCMFRGREMARVGLGQAVVSRIVEELSDIAQTESPPRQMGRNYSLVLAPVGKKKN
ncbi:translation initiation factor IF-3 [Candidatus Neptunochlamydia vexilliferae]|uniref:Translation initiation factor IF-3 n=1 Tax=Candidatus Neptunichlamydia vexilliferae TaxID=1651774 RepID=A0ABS0AZB4_9BACT|nr:translation initiation factor IF-3 [Candidatus Neptunochlamydia vexilliferae]MBF5058675.1 Translation initiation factor IF-3 [Candidatus Neptunochlamydia vexilliferae]